LCFSFGGFLFGFLFWVSLLVFSFGFRFWVSLFGFSFLIFALSGFSSLILLFGFSFFGITSDFYLVFPLLVSHYVINSYI